MLALQPAHHPHELPALFGFAVLVLMASLLSASNTATTLLQKCEDLKDTTICSPNALISVLENTNGVNS